MKKIPACTFHFIFVDILNYCRSTTLQSNRRNFIMKNVRFEYILSLACSLGGGATRNKINVNNKSEKDQQTEGGREVDQ